MDEENRDLEKKIENYPTIDEDEDDEMSMLFSTPITEINIGVWRRRSVITGDLTAEIYYGKGLIWRFVDGESGLQREIRIPWCDIIGMKADTPGNQPGILQIELGKPPVFYQQVFYGSTKHIWMIKQTTDFTEGQAALHRIHVITCPTGFLNQFYGMLTQDVYLLGLSQKPFPILKSPYFNI